MLNGIVFTVDERENFVDELYIYKLNIDDKHQIVVTIDNSKRNNGSRYSVTNDLTKRRIDGLEVCADIKCNVQREKMVKELILKHVIDYIEELQQASTALKELIKRPTTKTKEQIEHDRAAAAWNAFLNDK